MALILDQSLVFTSEKSEMYGVFAIVSQQTKDCEQGWSRLPSLSNA